MGKCMRKVSWEHGWQHDRQDRDLTIQRSSPQYSIKEGRERSVNETRLEKVLGWLGRVMGVNNMWASRPLKYSTGPIQQNPGKRGWTPAQSLQEKYLPTEAVPRPCPTPLHSKVGPYHLHPSPGRRKRVKSPLVCGRFSELDETWTFTSP